MAFPACHKTVFVLDRSPYFLNSFEQPIYFDVFSKARQPGLIPLATVAKCLWTCTVEAVIEYCRIVWDVYPTSRLIRFLVSEKKNSFLNSWNKNDQSLNKIMNHFAELGPPENVKQDDCSILAGIASAIEALLECSKIQQEKLLQSDNSANDVKNNGRIICITNIQNKSQRKYIEEGFLELLTEHNHLASTTDNMIPLNSCELVIINVVPYNQDINIANIPCKKLSNLASFELHSVKSGSSISNKLSHLVLQHYTLASTTVTGIPMKEEQNASSSANYDVELFHPADAHNELFKMGAAKAEGVPLSTIRDGTAYPTVTLKWCTPRSSTIELQHCTGVYRITTVDVNSRPSSCLTNFLLNGRAVMLEMPKKSGSRAMSHMLASHGGEIFIHTLGTTSRSILEDPPSISEGCGGRVTDYRIKDLGEFMKDNRLAPMPNFDEGISPILSAKEKLDRQTKYWPLILSNSAIFNMSQQLQPLLTLVVKEKLTEEDVVDCKKVIYKLVHMESKNDALTFFHVPGTRGKGPKREEQYRVVWNELENYVSTYATTADHQVILDCIQECRQPGENELATKPSPKKLKSEIIEPENLSKKNSESDSKNAIELSAKRLKPINDLKTKSGGSHSILSLWKNRINTKHSKRHVEFSGRLKATGNVAQLYNNLTDAEMET